MEQLYFNSKNIKIHILIRYSFFEPIICSENSILSYIVDGNIDQYNLFEKQFVSVHPKNHKKYLNTFGLIHSWNVIQRQ